MTAASNPTPATLDAAVEAAARSAYGEMRTDIIRRARWKPPAPWDELSDLDKHYWLVAIRPHIETAWPILAAARADQLARAVGRECTALCNDLEQDRDEWEVRALKAEAALAQAHAAGSAAGATAERERIVERLEAEEQYLVTAPGKAAMRIAAAIARAGTSEVDRGDS